MVKPVTYYKCEICGYEHKTEADALECEALPIEGPVHSIGDSIAFDLVIDADFRQVESMKGVLVSTGVQNFMKTHQLYYYVKVDEQEYYVSWDELSGYRSYTDNWGLR